MRLFIFPSTDFSQLPYLPSALGWSVFGTRDQCKVVCRKRNVSCTFRFNVCDIYQTSTANNMLKLLNICIAILNSRISVFDSSVWVVNLSTLVVPILLLNVSEDEEIFFIFLVQRVSANQKKL
ncbi:hypothetical protein AVEN_155011-1 [Araneus ventricosus]|uniref:Uncharacterized protein n=1 Tax=Araneus ventricosus TaxID=182803 RepID=A0A4Y2A9U2_ARAVE|nr:hypothetical protein AVEN_155011-1 [Araneus ventricosus]